MINIHKSKDNALKNKHNTKDVWNTCMSSRRKEVAMGKVVFNVQDQFLNQARKERVPIIVTLIDNTKVEGFVKSFDPFCILIQTEKPILIYKHAVGRIEPAEVNSKLKDFLAG